MAALRTCSLIALFMLPVAGPTGLVAQESPVKRGPQLAFTPLENGLFSFQTGTVAGQLRGPGRAFGLNDVKYVPSGQMMSGAYGLFGVYRVFSDGQRYGHAGWEWPSTATGNPDGSVTVQCTAEEGRPFLLRGIYRWSDPATMDLVIEVIPQRDLHGFEVFLASYFDPAFAQSSALVADLPRTPGKSGFMPAEKSLGDWLMFPRDPAAVKMIQDGRWELPPNPVNWAILPQLARPLAMRRVPGSGLTVLFMAPKEDCFAIAMPYETEGHFSVYLSLFGRDLPAGKTATARARLQVLSSPGDEDIEAAWRAYAH